MRLLRRTIHVLAWIGTAAIAFVALALIVSQTPWFRDWIRRTIVREAKQYLNGELTIGQVSGNLFYGINLSDVAVDVSGDRVVAVKTLAVDYNLFQLATRGIVIDRIELTAPAVHLIRDASGWNIGRLVKAQRREANRQGPNRSITLPKIVITDGTVRIDDGVKSPNYVLPRRLDDLDVIAKFAYEPVHFTVELSQFNVRTTEPTAAVHQLAGGIAVRDDNLYLDALALKTDETSLTFDGVIEQYLRARVIKVVTKGNVSLPEISGFLPFLAGYDVHPVLTVNANGTADRLGLDLDIQSEVGVARGKITADLVSPDFSLAGQSHVDHLNLARILKNPAQRSDITGDAVFTVNFPSAPATVPMADRLTAVFTFHGPHVLAFGYEATQVQVKGSVKGPRIDLASTKANAYGGTATATGFIVLPGPKRLVAYDLRGSADHLDLRRLPPSLKVPKLDTLLSVADYHVTGAGSAASGEATLHRSEIEGATIGDGTVVEFDYGHGPFRYGGRGTLSGLDVRRLGRALAVSALDDPRYEGRVSGAFDLTASGTSLAELTLDATGTLTDASMMGAHVSNMAFKADIANSGLDVYAKGNFDQLNPATITGNKAVDGNVNGTVDATFRIADLSAPITPAAITADGRVTLAPSLIGGVQIAAADVDAKYDAEVADIRTLQVKGPDVTLEASGRLALDRTSASNLKYHIDATDITEVGRLAGQTGLDGSLLLDGTITGNAASLETTGKLHGSGLAYGDNKALDLNSQYTVTVPNLDVVNARVKATSEATFVSAGGLQINQVTATTTYEQKQLQFATKLQERTREVEASGSVIFHPDHQELHLPQLAVRTAGVEWRSAEGSQATVQYGQGRLTLKDVRLTSGDQALDVSGSFALQAEEPSGAIEVHARNVDIAQIEQLMLINRGFTGRLTADATISGTTKQPVVDGKVEVRDGGFQSYKYQSLVADVDYEGNKIKLDATLQQSPDVAITARGTVPMSAFSTGAAGHVAASAGDAIDLRIQTASLNLGVIQGFTKAVTQVAGNLQADVRVTGSGRDPHFDGFIEIRDGAFGVPQAGTSYSGLDTRIDLGDELVRIRRFEILDENGEQLAVSGQLALHERSVGAVDITLESQNFEIIDNELGDVQVGVQLKVAGSLARPRVEGNVRMPAGRLEVDRILQLFYDPYSVSEMPEVVSAERTIEGAESAEDATKKALAKAEQGGVQPAAVATPEPAPAPTPGLFDRVALAIKLNIPDNLVLRGRRLRPGGPTRASVGDVNLTVGGDLDIRKNPGEPVTLVGTVTTVRGTYQFQGRQFELARNGTIRFTGDADFNPLLDITATRQIPDTGVEARVHITGTVKTPELQLSSTPPLDEADVLALIVFNRPINDLGTGERASLAATAGGIATGFIATPLGESIGRALNLDLFEITTSADGDSIGGVVTVGQQLGDRAFFKVRQQFGERTYTEFLIDYRLTSFLRAEASGAPESSGTANRVGQRRIERAGIDLIFFFSY